MDDWMTVSEAARRLEHMLERPVPPRLISDMFYQRRLPETLAPVVGGRRLISERALPLIADVVRERDQKVQDASDDQPDDRSES